MQPGGELYRHAFSRGGHEHARDLGARRKSVGVTPPVRRLKPAPLLASALDGLVAASRDASQKSLRSNLPNDFRARPNEWNSRVRGKAISNCPIFARAS